MSTLYLVKASDPVLRSRAVVELLDELVGDEDRTLVVEDFTVPTKTRGGSTDDEAPPADDGSRMGVVAAVVNAAQSPPFMTTKRIVVLRDFEQLNAEEAGAITAMLEDPLESTVFVFVSGGGRGAKGLLDALKAAETVGPDSEKTTDVLAAELERGEISLDGEAARAVAQRLGEDAGRAAGLVDVLVAAFGPGAKLGLADVEPYLGEAGAVPVFQLTNAIEEGQVAGALAVVDRLLTVTSARQPKPMHPLQILGMLQSRYRKLLRVDDPAIRSASDAHAALGGKGSTFPSKKIFEASRALGSDGLRKAVDSLHQADIDLKGASAMPENAVLEVLVARLAAMHGRSGAGRSSGRGAARSRR